MGMPDFHQDLDAMQFDFEGLLSHRIRANMNSLPVAPMEPLEVGRLRSSEVREALGQWSSALTLVLS